MRVWRLRVLPPFPDSRVMTLGRLRGDCCYQCAPTQACELGNQRGRLSSRPNVLKRWYSNKFFGLGSKVEQAGLQAMSGAVLRLMSSDSLALVSISPGILLLSRTFSPAAFT